MSIKHKPKKRVTKPRTKMFKGCLKVPLNTHQDIQEMINQSKWYGDWLVKHSIILKDDVTRKWYINAYLYNILGEISLEKIQTESKLSKRQFDDLIDYVLKEVVEKHPAIDYSKSYFTISC